MKAIELSPICNKLILFILTRFNENIMIDPGSIDVFPASRIPKNIQHQSEPICHPTLSPTENLPWPTYKKKERGFRITTDFSTLSSVLRWVPDAEVASLWIICCILIIINLQLTLYC